MDIPTEFDHPLFKKLANNDTGKAVGHQGGIVIPKDLNRYFPDLSGKVTTTSATVDEPIRAALFVKNSLKGVVVTRYQYQTWGHTRRERRITGNLAALRNAASEGDYLIIERSLDDPIFFRLRLLDATDPDFKKVRAKIGDRKWGSLDLKDQPVTEKAVVDALAAQKLHEGKSLDIFDNAAVLVEVSSTRIARSRAFQQRVTALYNFRCAVCGHGFVNSQGFSEIEAAHIVPRGLQGADDARNGLALCRSHHWAFDRGLFGIMPTGQILIPPKILELPQNIPLGPLASMKLLPPTDSGLAPAPAALQWHLKHIVNQHL